MLNVRHDSQLPRPDRRHHSIMPVHHYWSTVSPPRCEHVAKSSKRMRPVRFASTVFTSWEHTPLPHRCPQHFRNAGPHSSSLPLNTDFVTSCAAVATDKPMLTPPKQIRRHNMRRRRDPQAAVVQAMYPVLCLEVGHEEEQALSGAIAGNHGHALIVGVCSPRKHPLCQSLPPRSTASPGRLFVPRTCCTRTQCMITFVHPMLLCQTTARRRTRESNIPSQAHLSC